MTMAIKKKNSGLISNLKWIIRQRKQVDSFRHIFGSSRLAIDDGQEKIIHALIYGIIDGFIKKNCIFMFAMA